MVFDNTMGDLKQDDEVVENIGLGCALELFREVDEVMNMIENLKTVYSNGEAAYERFIYILSVYQEQPHLLDPHLDKMLASLVTIVRSPESPMELKHEAFKYLHEIMVVRSYKVVVRHLPHEVSDFEPVLKILESQDPNDKSTWQTRHVLILWLSIIVMIPFHMSLLDSFRPDEDVGESRRTVMSRILNICKMYVVRNDQYANAALLIARFLTRSDVKEVHLASFLDWACQFIGSPDSDEFAQCGALASMAAILKHGKREDLLPHAPTLLRWILESKHCESQNTLVRKYSVKVVQRIGLTFLKTRVAVWRYQRGCRSLAANLSSGDQSVRSIQQVSEESEVTEDFEIPEEIEEVIEELMQTLKDSLTVNRWSAAKGIGRVTSRLPKELADEVVGSVLELFNPRESDSAWHGGCLALAELGRRGLLLPRRLKDVVPVVLKALVYDEPRGYVSVGTHIRDAACYVCWSFARAYDTEVLKPFVKDIAGALLVVAVFDREINVRRAASAAFQENVGRQGTFPHGIDILTTADYFAVGVRNNAFLNISVFIAQYEEYTFPLIRHLIDRKIDHWDGAIRELSAKALHNLTPCAMEYMSKIVLPILLDKTKSIDLNTRHGAVLSIGEILHALSILANQSGLNISHVVDSTVIEGVRELVPLFSQRHQFRGLGGEHMKQACCHLIEKCSLSKMPYHDQDIIDEWQTLLDGCLSHEVSIIRQHAAAALPALFTEYYSGGRDSVTARYTQQLSINNQVVRMGFCLAFASFPKFMLEKQLHRVIPALIACSQVTPTTLKWSESRRDAIKALTSICNTVGVGNSESGPSCAAFVDDLYKCFLVGMSEYTMDSRGDIGAWVREASMTAVQSLSTLLAKTNSFLLEPSMVEMVMVNLAKQAVEKIDRTRAHAGKAFTSLLYNKPTLPHIPCHKEVMAIFPEDICKEQIKWLAGSDTFPRFTELLALPPYSYSVLLGLVVSIGGLTESLVKHSSSSLFSYLKGFQENPTELNRLCNIIVEIFSKHQFEIRVIVPLLSFLDRLIGSGCIRSVLQDPNSTFAPEILHHVKVEISKTREASKLVALVEVLCQLIQVKGSVSSGALMKLCIFLCNRFLWVRKMTATRMYEALMLYGEDSAIPSENLDDVMTLLSDTNWEEEVGVVKPIRNKLCELIGIPVPKVVKKT